MTATPHANPDTGRDPRRDRYVARINAATSPRHKLATAFDYLRAVLAAEPDHVVLGLADHLVDLADRKGTLVDVPAPATTTTTTPVAARPTGADNTGSGPGQLFPGAGTKPPLAVRQTARRRTYHQARLDAAPDSRGRFWAACNTLAAAARGRHDEAADMVLAVVDTIRNGRRA